MLSSELDFELPEELIAQRPLPERDGARLLCLDSRLEHVLHQRVRDLPKLLPPALWVINDTRVIPARLYGTKESGGSMELLLVEPITKEGTKAVYWCMGKASKGLRPGHRFVLGKDFTGRVLARRDEDGFLQVELTAPNVDAAIEAHGHMPLPPYITRAADKGDAERYQTVYATHGGAVAAPTAGLHLSQSLMERLETAGHRFARVTLHVGPGTFAPLRSEQLSEHPMHAEHYVVPEETAQAIENARREGRMVLAVGTTVVRTLEAATIGRGLVQPGPGSTDIFIYPPYEFQVVDILLTNFHLPRSTLLALVMAFAGTNAVRLAYAEAVRERYRFFSYGDAMLIGNRI